MNAAALLAIALVCQVPCFEAAPAPKPMPVVEQEVECISVAHWGGDCQMIFFWDLVQGEFVLLDHKWLDVDNCQVVWHDGAWCVTWQDNSVLCYRIVRTQCFVESWEHGNPIADQCNAPWFRQLLEPGLKAPPKVEAK